MTNLEVQSPFVGKDESEKNTDFCHLPPGWCLIKYVPYLPIELFLALLPVVCPQLQPDLTAEMAPNLTSRLMMIWEERFREKNSDPSKLPIRSFMLML
ncbi:hypothetical protein TNCV_615721 [Trichonephila clavipes]|nr:hypothetical protein TNCV_615721 [Trichonephila clavipes]